MDFNYFITLIIICFIYIYCLLVVKSNDPRKSICPFVITLLRKAIVINQPRAGVVMNHMIAVKLHRAFKKHTFYNTGKRNVHVHTSPCRGTYAEHELDVKGT